MDTTAATPAIMPPETTTLYEAMCKLQHNACELHDGNAAEAAKNTGILASVYAACALENAHAALVLSVAIDNMTVSAAEMIV